MKKKRNRLLHSDSDSDPMGTVANLFDVAMVFAVALMVALVSRFKKYTPSEDQKTSGKRGKKVGVAYQLENGEIIYVPE